MEFPVLYLSGRFDIEILRPGDLVKNLESPELSGRIDSPENVSSNAIQNYLKTVT